MVGYADKEKRKNEEKKNFFCIFFVCMCRARGPGTTAGWLERRGITRYHPYRVNWSKSDALGHGGASAMGVVACSSMDVGRGEAVWQASQACPSAELASAHSVRTVPSDSKRKNRGLVVRLSRPKAGRGSVWLLDSFV